MAKVGQRNRPLAWQRIAVGLAWLPAALSIPGAEVQLFLRNGDRLTGQILIEDARQLTFSNAVLGRVLIPASEVLQREDRPVPAAPPKAASAPPRPLNELVADYKAGKIAATDYYALRAEAMSAAASARGVAPPPRPAPSTAPAPVSALPPKPTHIVTGEVQAGMDLGFGTRDRSLYTGRFKLNYSQAGFSNQVDYLFTYGETEDELSANRMYGSLKTDCRLHSSLYAYNLFTGSYDVIRKIDHSYNIGPGVGNHFSTRKDLAFDAEAGLNYQFQKDSSGVDMNSLFYRFAQAFRWLASPRISFEEKLDLITKYDDLSNYKLRLEAGAKYALNARLSLNLGIINIYDTSPAPGVEPNDLQIVSTIGVRF